jgi:hypothetical protein
MQRVDIDSDNDVLLEEDLLEEDLLLDLFFDFDFDSDSDEEELDTCPPFFEEELSSSIQMV